MRTGSMRWSARSFMGAALAVVLVGVLALCGCSTTSGRQTALDPANPVRVEVWTYYNGTQQQAFEQLVSEFNDTRGKDLGVVVSHSTRGGINDLRDAVTASAQGLVGAGAMPDAFLSYADSALVIDQLGKVADLSPYLTDEEVSSYVDAFIQEGDLDGSGSIKIFPVGKSTETMQIDATDWQKFASATNSSLDELTTIEGVTKVSQRYYEWTDAQTPDIANDGKAFFGRDALANYMLTGSAQLGHPIFSVQNGEGTIALDKTTLRALWDNYYVPMVKGYFSDEGRFRSDAVKTGGLVCYVGSLSSVVYFPDTVTIDDATSYPIEFTALAAPVFANGTPCATQQGAGFVVSKSSEKKEEACVEFLKWITDKERNTAFAVSAGYMPVKKDALTQENIEEVAKSLGSSTEKYLVNLPATLDTVDMGFYANQPFEGGMNARDVMKDSLVDKSAADRAAVVASLQAGASYDDALAPYLTDENFEAWLISLDGAMKVAVTS